MEDQTLQAAPAAEAPAEETAAGCPCRHKHREAPEYDSLIRRQLRQDINKHALGLLLCQGYIVLNLDPFDSQVIQHAADQIHRICGGGQGKFFPFHIAHTPVYIPLITLTNKSASTTSTTGRTIFFPS